MLIEVLIIHVHYTSLSHSLVLLLEPTERKWHMYIQADLQTLKLKLNNMQYKHVHVWTIITIYMYAQTFLLCFKQVQKEMVTHK